MLLERQELCILCMERSVIAELVCILRRFLDLLFCRSTGLLGLLVARLELRLDIVEDISVRHSLIDPFERRIDEDLRLRTGNQHTLLAAQDDVPKRHLSCHVLERLSPAPPQHRIMHESKLRLVERTVEADIDLDPREAGRIADEPFGRKPWMLVSLALEIVGAPLEHAPDSPGSVSHRFCSFRKQGAQRRPARLTIQMKGIRRSLQASLHGLLLQEPR